MSPRLLPWLTFFFATGIATADLGFWAVGSALQLGFAGFGLGLLVPRWRVAAALVVALAAGAVSLAHPLEMSRNRPVRAGFEAVVEGRVCARGGSHGWAAVDLCDTRTLALPGFGHEKVPGKIRLSATADRGAFTWLAGLPTDSWIRVRARIRPLATRSNPGSPGWARRLVRRGIGARATPQEPLLGVRVRVSGERPGSGLAASLRALRSETARTLQAHGGGGGLAAALVLGDSQGLDRERRAHYAALGISHLLAISGLHVMWIGGLAYALALQGGRWWPRMGVRGDGRRRAALVAVVVAGVYVVVGGGGVPLRRAWVLLVGLVVGVIAGRRIRAPEALAVAGLVILVAQPEALFELGPQLSFAASAALLLGRNSSSWEPVDASSMALRSWRALCAMLRVTATAMAVTIPLLAIHGLPVTLVGLVSNLLAVPVFATVVLPLSFLAAALAALPGTGELVTGVCEWLGVFVRALDPLGVFATRFLFHATPSLLALVLSLALGWGSLALRRTSSRVLGAVAAGWVLVAFPRVPEPGALPRVVVLDVGRGDAIVVQGRGAAVLVDGGWASSGGADLGRSVVVPALRALGIERLDLVVATHADADHRGGLASVVEAMPVDELWLPKGSLGDPDWRALLVSAGQRGLAVRERSAADAVAVHGDLRVETLWPPDVVGSFSRNDGSLVTRVEVAGRGILLPGDVGHDVEAELVASRRTRPGDVLVVPHHGSRGSSSPVFLEAVAAPIAVVSAPCQPSSRLPSAETLARLVASGAAAWWTGRDGAVEIRLGRRLTVWGWATDESEPACRWRGAN